MPILATLLLPKYTLCLNAINEAVKAGQKQGQSKRRWDHAALHVYYDGTRELLQPIFNCLQSLYSDWVNYSYSGKCYNCYYGSNGNVESKVSFNKSKFTSTVSNSIDDDCLNNVNINLCDSSIYSNDFRNNIISQLDDVYNQIIDSLVVQADSCIPVITDNFFKFWWDEEMTLLKANSCSSHNAWLAAGRPGSGPVFDAKRVAKAAYRKRIRDHKFAESNSVSNSLHDSLLQKSHTQFWSIWKKKFGKQKVFPSVIENRADSHSITEGFANFFASVCQNESSEVSRKFSMQFQNKFSTYSNVMNANQMSISVDSIDKIIRGLSKGKAAGIDGITVEHIIYSHPIIISILNLFFKLLIDLEHVPPSFKIGIIIPIPKNDSNSNSDKFSDYRGITISPVISKIFEQCLLENVKCFLTTSDLQLGFKKGLGCNHAIYIVQEVISYFTANNSTVNLCALDLSKAFDKVNYCALFSTLIDKHVPSNIINLLLGWFSQSVATVKWNSCFSSSIRIGSGVRQGGVLSPFLFAVFVDVVLVKLKNSSLGCRLKGVLINAIMYADDLLLLAISLHDLQLMVDLCYKEFQEIGLSLNLTKSSCLKIGPGHNIHAANITINETALEWKSELKYLGVTFLKAPTIKYNLQIVRQHYFRSLNGIFGKIGASSPVNVTISLINSFCVPLLAYGSEAFKFNSSMYNVLDSAYNAAFFKIFKSYDKQIIKLCQYYCGCFPLAYVIDKRKISFLWNFVNLSNSILSLLFMISGRFELDKMLSKHKLNVNSVCQVKHRMWANFAISCIDS